MHLRCLQLADRLDVSKYLIFTRVPNGFGLEKKVFELFELLSALPPVSSLTLL